MGSEKGGELPTSESRRRVTPAEKTTASPRRATWRPLCAKERTGSEELDEGLATARSWVRERPTQLLSLAGLVFVVLKLLAVSKFSPATALALATSAGPGQVLLAAILLGYPLLLTALAAVTLTQILVELAAARRGQGGAPDEGGRTGEGEVARRPARRIWPLILVSLVTLALLDLVMAGFLLVIFFLYLIPVLSPGEWPQAVPGIAQLARARELRGKLEAERDLKRRAKIHAKLDKLGSIHLGPVPPPLTDEDTRRKLFKMIAAIRLFTFVPPAVLFLVLTFPQMWLPPEIVQVEDHRIVAYVVSTEGRWTTLLREKDRAILRTKSDLVSGRQICGLPSTLRTPSLVQWVARADAVKLAPCFP
jgi:hypothetical protein